MSSYVVNYLRINGQCCWQLHFSPVDAPEEGRYCCFCSIAAPEIASFALERVYEHLILITESTVVARCDNCATPLQCLIPADNCGVCRSTLHNFLCTRPLTELVELRNISRKSAVSLVIQSERNSVGNCPELILLPPRLSPLN
jgi:hypothetical protein